MQFQREGNLIRATMGKYTATASTEREAYDKVQQLMQQPAIGLAKLVGKRVAVSQGYMQFTGTLARHDDDYRVTDGITAVAVFPSTAVASIEEMDTRMSVLTCADFRINLQEIEK